MDITIGINPLTVVRLYPSCKILRVEPTHSQKSRPPQSVVRSDANLRPQSFRKILGKIEMHCLPIPMTDPWDDCIFTYMLVDFFDKYR